jgi:hypothetical protein
MKNALAYAIAAILLGTVTMLAPLMLITPGDIQLLASGDGEKARTYCPHVETLDAGNTLDEGDFYGRAISPSNISSAGLMLIPSFLIALGAFLYLKKRTS